MANTWAEWLADVEEMCPSSEVPRGTVMLLTDPAPNVLVVRGERGWELAERSLSTEEA